MTNRLARLLLLTGALAVPAAFVGCGSDSASTSTTERSSASEGPAGAGTEGTDEDESGEGHEVVPDSEVTSGLAELEKMGVAVVAAAAAGNASAADVDAMFQKWETFEGTIKQNDPDLYLTIEDNLAGLRTAAEQNDGPGATKAMSALSKAAASYLAEHP